MNQKKLQKLRRNAFAKQNCLCFYCQLPMWEADPQQFASGCGLPTKLAKHLKCTAEHLVARQDKGCDTEENIVAACLWCNHTRHIGRRNKAPDPMTFKAKIQRLVAQGKWHPVIASNHARQKI